MEEVLTTEHFMNVRHSFFQYATPLENGHQDLTCQNHTYVILQGIDLIYELSFD